MVPIKGGGVTTHRLLSGLGADDHLQYLLLIGRIGGQVIGSGAHTGGNPTDLAVEGRLLLGDITGINYTANRILDIRSNPTSSNSTALNLQINAASVSTFTGNFTNLQLIIAGTPTAASGSAAVRGFFFTSSITIPYPLTATTVTGGVFQVTPAASGTPPNMGVIGSIYGIQTIAQSPVSSGFLGITGGTFGIWVRTGGSAGTTPLECGIQIANAPQTGSFVTQYYGIVLSAFPSTAGMAPRDLANTTDWTGIKIPDVLSPTGTVLGLDIGAGLLKNKLGGPTTICGTTLPIHGLDSQSSAGLKITANKTAAYGAASETFIPCDANTVGAFAVTLPTAVGISGRIYVIKKVDASANAVTVTPTGAETIDGAANYPLNAQWQVVRVVSNGANWLIW
jgi:hypothetical protein